MHVSNLKGSSITTRKFKFRKRLDATREIIHNATFLLLSYHVNYRIRLHESHYSNNKLYPNSIVNVVLILYKCANIVQ